MIESPHRIDRQVLYGLLFLALVGALIAGTIAKYRGVFEDNVAVVLEADRAGLTLAKGAPIKLRGVEIGHVGSVDTDGKSVRIGLEINSDSVDDVPADVTAQIVPPTAFGAKYVQLTAAGPGTSQRIAAGDVIPATRVTVEVNEVFENLSEVLDVARPAQVNAALTAVADAVDQRGEVLGDLINRTDAYLTGFNPALTRMSKDLALADDVLDVYAGARPALVGTLDHAADLSDTAVRRQASLRALTVSLGAFSDRTDMLLRSSQHGIFTSLTLIEPVGRTVARYSPELPCIILGLATLNAALEPAVGGANPGLTTATRIVPGRPAYAPGKNLPLVGDDRGPVCFGLPFVTPAESEQPPPVLHTGANPYAGSPTSAQTATLDTLFGMLAGGANQP